MRKRSLPVRCLIACSVLCLCGCASRGKAVFIREGCVTCHHFRGLGGGLAPDLSEVGSRRDAAALRSKITNPAASEPASRMPAFDRLSWFDLRSLIAFLRG